MRIADIISNPKNLDGSFIYPDSTTDWLKYPGQFSGTPYVSISSSVRMVITTVGKHLVLNMMHESMQNM